MIRLILLSICLSLLLGFGKSLTAQVEQDKWLLGASSNFSFQNTEGGGSGNQRTLNFATKFGYFISDNLALGVQLSASNLKVNNDVTTELSIGSFARYYFVDSFFAGLGYSVTRLNRQVDSVSRSDMGSYFSIEVGYPIWVLIDSLTIEPTLDYAIGSGDLLKGRNRLSMNIGLVLYL